MPHISTEPAATRSTRRVGAALLSGAAASLVLSTSVAGVAASAASPDGTPSGAGTAARQSSSAGTLVYIYKFNVWIARGDGSGARALSTDGTFAFPYGAPSQSDAGVVVASHNKLIVRMTQSGRVLNTIDPRPLPTGAGDDIDGTPIDLAISPDGSRIAYTFSQTCSGGTPCSATGYTRSTGFDPAGDSTYFWDPSWVTDTRTLQTGGWDSQVQLHDVGSAPKYWFDDRMMSSPPTDLGDTELSPDGRHLAAIRGYGEDTAMVWYDVNGSAKQGPPPGLPDLFCGIPWPGITGPTWAPDSDSLAWQEGDGIWAKAGVDDCSSTQRLVIPGGSEPDWSAARLSAVSVAALRNQARPVITGAAKVGRKLTATVGRWSPAPSAFRFQWMRNGKAIKGATTRGHRVVRADRGTRLTVRVTASRAGHRSASATTAPRRVR
ncbi:hypothetical protein LRP67_01870 [Nocardioides sp. cx-169]|uniref:hypothetical protein n=1 Tax=Nocardioides sp. cx-169 TaxID=2899080 RepID=UPI001E57B1A2|nr:hypothetical protein [Nocardioides sp. cx-169]MCD4532833.1 hypothetical protein [Nocardioides sp. cx-169]